MLVKKYCPDFQTKVFLTIHVTTRPFMFLLLLTSRADEL